MIVTNKLTPDCFHAVYREIAEVFGSEIAIGLHDHFGGQNLSLSQKLFSDSYIRQIILSEYTGKNSREIAKKIGCTPNWITKLYRIYRKEMGDIE